MPTIEYKLQGDSKSLVSAVTSAEGAMGKATLAAGALSAGALALGSAYAKLVDDTVAVVDEVNTLAAATGLSTESINGLRLAAKASGKELTDIVPQKLAKNMLAAADSGGAMADAFGRVGVEFADANGNLRDASEVFPELIQGLSEMDNRTEAAAVAAQLLGKNGKELLTAFEDQEGFQKFVDLGNEFGIQTGPEAVAAAGQWQVATANLSLAFENMGQRLLDVLGGNGAAADALDQFTLGLVLVTEFSAEVADRMIGNFEAIGGAISNLLAGNFEAAAESASEFQAGITPITESLEAATERAFTFWQLQQQGAEAATEASGEHFAAIQDQNAAMRERERTAKAAAQAEKDRAAEAKQAAEDEAQFLSDIAQLEAELAEETLEAKREAIREEQALRQSAADFQLRLDEKVAEQQALRREAANIALDASLEASIAGVDALLEAQVKAAGAAEGATKKEQRAKRRAIKRTFAAQQALGVTSIAIDAARSILSLIPAFAFLGPGAPVAAAGVVTPLAAVQTAAVLSQEPPTFHDGTANVDEVLATLKTEEAVLNQRGAESIGRERIDRANRGEPIGGTQVSQIVFQNRVLDQMVSSVMQAGGQTSRIIGAGRPPAGTLDPFGGI